MTCLGLSGPEGLRIGRCLVGSPCKTDLETETEIFIGIIHERQRKPDRKNQFLVDNSFDGLSYRSEIIIPIESMVFDPFAAMKEGVKTDKLGMVEAVTDFGCLSISKNGECLTDEISLDIEWACTLDGVEVVEI